ncbi:hypothetical protein [Thermococcus sp. JCM 11816]|uniref:hypothetical protein n=1 Tax=Thermococcus sp. (strain JCM 11816 / KS-1) TaxID=1295125 RepID=UPI003466A3B3
MTLMFEEIIKKLLETNAPTTSKLKIPLAGIKAFETIIKSKESIDPDIAVKIAVAEFTKYSTGDPEVITNFKKIVKREFSKLNNPKLLKKKARVSRRYGKPKLEL